MFIKNLFRATNLFHTVHQPRTGGNGSGHCPVYGLRNNNHHSKSPQCCIFMSSFYPLKGNIKKFTTDYPNKTWFCTREQPASTSCSISTSTFLLTELPKTFTICTGTSWRSHNYLRVFVFRCHVNLQKPFKVSGTCSPHLNTRSLSIHRIQGSFTPALRRSVPQFLPCIYRKLLQTCLSDGPCGWPVFSLLH